MALRAIDRKNQILLNTIVEQYVQWAQKSKSGSQLQPRGALAEKNPP